MEPPAEGRKLVISERSLRELFQTMMLADENNLLGSCQDKNVTYCGPCWAMEEAQALLLDLKED